MIVDGEAEISPGVIIHPAFRAHTAGSQLLEVPTASASWCSAPMRIRRGKGSATGWSRTFSRPTRCSSSSHTRVLQDHRRLQQLRRRP